jgi:hypothetical protein
MQHGAPLAVIGLTAPDSADRAAGWADDLLLPSTYQAFACLGGSSLPMPNVVAQIGAAPAGEVARFWRGFYASLGEKLAVERAMNDGRGDRAPLPMALFLRQDQEETFHRLGEAPADSVTQINAELTQSLKTLERLRALNQPGSGLPGGMSDLMAEFERDQMARQKQLEDRLAPWVTQDEKLAP